MRKAFTIFLGLVLFAGASGLLYWRVETGRWLTSTGFESLTDAGPVSDAGPSRSGSEFGARSEEFPAGFTTSKLAMVFDVLNILVGVVGIWFTVVGIRMQRAEHPSS